MAGPSAVPRLLPGPAALLAGRVPRGCARDPAQPDAPDAPRHAASDIALDIALDETLARRAAHVARVWTPPGRAAILGVASASATELVLDACRADGLPILRRSTGGAAVLVTPEVACFSVVYPHERYPVAARISGAYALAFEGLARAFASLGLRVRFERPGDVALGGRKLAGLAQARRREATLVHGVIPVALDRSLLERYVAHPPSEPAYRAGRAHADFVTTLAHETDGPVDELMTKVLEALARAFCGDPSSRREPPADLDGAREDARALVAERYSRDEWTFRR